MIADRTIANGLRLAHQDLEAARILASSNNRYAIYHCEQAAEKIIKSVLTSEGQHAGPRHDLDELVDLIPDANPLKPLLRDIERLAAFATAYRYVTSHGNIPPAPDPGTVEAHIGRVEKALTAATSAFQVDLDDPGTPARRPVPPR